MSRTNFHGPKYSSHWGSTVYFSVICFVSTSSQDSGFNNRNRILTAKHFNQGTVTERFANRIKQTDAVFPVFQSESVWNYMLHIILFSSLQILFYTPVTFSNDGNKFYDVASFVPVARHDIILKEIVLCSRRKDFLQEIINAIFQHKSLKTASEIKYT